MKLIPRLLQILTLTTLLAGAGCDRYKSKAEADFDKGFWAYRTGDYFNAIRYLTPIAQQGHPGAQMILGRMYALGEGVQQDAGQAATWLNSAADTLNHNLQQAEVKPLAEKPMADVMMETLDDAMAKNTTETDMRNVNHDLGGQVMGKVVQEASSKEVLSATPVEPESAAVGAPGKTQSADELTLQNLRDRANLGDRRAVHLLIEAYKKGLYGLTPDAEKLSHWRMRAIELAAPPPEKPVYARLLDRLKATFQ